MTKDEYTEEIKKYLRQGMIVVAPRQVGKTTAILQFAMELQSNGFTVAIQVPSVDLARMTKAMWIGIYDREINPPQIEVSPENIRADRVLVDEKSLCRRLHAFFAATDSRATILRGFESAGLAERYGKGEPTVSGHIKVILPMFTSDIEV